MTVSHCHCSQVARIRQVSRCSRLFSIEKLRHARFLKRSRSHNLWWLHNTNFSRARPFASILSRIVSWVILVVRTYRITAPRPSPRASHYSRSESPRRRDPLARRKIRKLIRNAPKDRIWRRRGWLMMIATSLEELDMIDLRHGPLAIIKRLVELNDTDCSNFPRM